MAGEFRSVTTGLALIEQLAQIDHRGVGARKVVGHHERVVGREAVAAAVHNHRRSQRAQARFQFTNDLSHTGFGILVSQYLGEIEFGRAEKVQ